MLYQFKKIKTKKMFPEIKEEYFFKFFNSEFLFYF